MSQTAYQTQTVYQIDPAHSSAHFSVRHMMIANVRGEFTKLSGEIKFDPESPENSSLYAQVDVASINTRDAQRDGHLKSADFFNAEQYPTIEFRSKKVSGNDGEYQVLGDLTVRGTTREVTLQVEGPTPETKDPWGNVRFGATATTKINRRDFGMTWNAALEAGGVLVGDDVKITLEIEAIRKD